MGNRILRDWTDSRKIDSLSADAERFFTRLIMKADDYGRYIADATLLRSSLFPLRVNKIKEDKIQVWLNDCQQADLIHCYEVDGKKYLEIKMFDQKLKVRKSKYPPSNGEDRIALQSGYVYVIGTSYSNPVKIGFSINPWSRLKEITANHHEELQILLTIKTEKRTESLIHAALKNIRTKNEWFLLNENVVEILERLSNNEIEVEEAINELRNYSVVTTTNYDKLHSSSTEIEVETEYEVEKKGNRNPPANTVFDLAYFEYQGHDWNLQEPFKSKLNEYLAYRQRNGWAVKDYQSIEAALKAFKATNRPQADWCAMIDYTILKSAKNLIFETGTEKKQFNHQPQGKQYKKL